MNLHDEARPSTAEDRERSNCDLAMRGIPLPADPLDEVFEVDDLIRAAMEADDAKTLEGLDDPAVLAQRLDTLKGIVWNQEARTRMLQERLDGIESVDAERGTLIQRIQSLERNFESFRKVLTDKEKRAEQALARDPATRAQHMNAWRYRSITKAREETIEAMLEGGRQFELMSHIHIQEYGDNNLDLPPDLQDIETPDFIVLDALPEVLRQAFIARFKPVASVIREEGPHVSLARFEDWQAFAKMFV